MSIVIPKRNNMTTPNQSISVDEAMALMVEWHQQVSEDPH